MIAVVVDEGLWILALQAEPGTPPAQMAAASGLLQALQVRAVWVISDDINQIYWRRIYGANYKGTLWNRLRTSLVQVLADSTRTSWIDDWTAVEGNYDHDDDCWVAAAAEFGNGCLLITEDRRLIDALHQCGIPRRHDFNVVDIEGAGRMLEN